MITKYMGTGRRCCKVYRLLILSFFVIAYFGCLVSTFTVHKKLTIKGSCVQSFPKFRSYYINGLQVQTRVNLSHLGEKANRQDEQYFENDANLTRKFKATDCPNEYYATVNIAKNIKLFVASLMLALTLTFGGPVPYSHAAFGPAGGASTSPPPNLAQIRVEEENLSGKKLKQLIASTLDERRLQEFSIQLDDLIEILKTVLTELTADTEVEDDNKIDVDLIREKIKERRAELEKARVFQQQVLERQRILEQLEKEPYWFNYFAAFVGSVASTLVMHPVDTIKTRLQVQKVSEDDDEEGFGNIISLYDGLSGNILKEGPPSALYLGVYETVKSYLLPLFGPQKLLLVYLMSGAAGELVGSVVRGPAEAIKSTVQSGIAESFTAAVARVFGSSENRANLVRAWSASVWRDVPFGAIQLAIFELTKSYILNNPDIDFDSSTLFAEAIFGAFAGGCGAFLTTPFDIITVRIITQPTDGEGDNKALGVVGMAQKVYAEGGPGAFLTGWEARVGYWAPAISIFLSSYCSVRQAGLTLFNPL